MTVSNDTLLQTLYDHHKDTFSWIYKREQLRNRHFLYVVAILGLLFHHRAFPSGVTSLLVAAAGTSAAVGNALPDYVVESVLWTVLFAVTLRYLQLGITVDRQYTYLHKIETELAAISGHDELFQREGKAYLEKYPVFSWWTYVVYVWGFPLLLVAVTSVLIWPTIRGKGSEYSAYNAFMYIAVLLSVLSRTLQPCFARLCGESKAEAKS